MNGKWRSQEKELRTQVQINSVFRTGWLESYPSFSSTIDQWISYWQVYPMEYRKGVAYIIASLCVPLVCFTCLMGSTSFHVLASPSPTSKSRDLANSFMQDLLTDHIAEAAKKWGTSSNNIQDGETVEKDFIRPILLLCGRPIDLKEESGSATRGQHLTPDGAARPTFTYFYSSKTTGDKQASKDHFTFRVGVEADDNGRFFVSGFGCCCSNPRPTRKRHPSNSI
jgi:hypothetical protein